MQKGLTIIALAIALATAVYSYCLHVRLHKAIEQDVEQQQLAKDDLARARQELGASLEELGSSLRDLNGRLVGLSRKMEEAEARSALARDRAQDGLAAVSLLSGDLKSQGDAVDRLAIEFQDMERRSSRFHDQLEDLRKRLDDAEDWIGWLQAWKIRVGAEIGIH